MPPRLELLTKRLPTFDLPILPFLAPRVFQPWPPRGQKLHSGSRRTQIQSEAVGAYRDKAQDISHARNAPSETSGRHDGRNNHNSSVSESARELRSTHEVIDPERSRDSLQETAKGHDMDTVEAANKEELKTKYHEIWGVPLPGVSVKTPQPPSQQNVLQEHGVRWTPVSLRLSKINYGLYKHYQASKRRGQKSPYRDHILSKRTKYRDTKVIRIFPGRGSNFICLYGSWHARLAAIKLRDHSNGQPAGYSNSSHRPNFARSKLLRAEIMEWVEHMSPSKLRRMWQEDFTETMRMKAWLELMMTTLELYPTKALPVLDATYVKPYPPSYAVIDSLHYIVNHYCRNQEDYPPQYFNDLSETLFNILVVGPRKQLYLSQHTIKQIMSRLDLGQRERFYEILVQIGHPLKENTLIQFSYQFARNGQTDLAFEVMQRLKNSAFNTPAMLSLCSTLLRRTCRDPNAVSTETTMFKFMVDCGLTPNVITHNVLIRNAIGDGDHQTAWQIHDMMKDVRIEPDVVTYSILLNDAKKRMDATDIGKVMKTIQEEKIRNPHIAADVLHAIFLLYQQKLEEGTENEHRAESKTAFSHMLPVYCETFQLEPLARIIPDFWKSYPKMTDLQLEAHRILLPPSQASLVIMITAYLSAIKNPLSARKFYDHFRSLVYGGNPSVQELTTTTRVWNWILFTFGRFPELMADCANMIGDMLSPAEKQPLEPASPDEFAYAKTSRPSFVPPKPDVYTWSILLKIFTDQKQTRAAEKVLSMMEDRGVKPNIITWNTLVNSYAEMQDVEMAADTIGRLEDAGLTADSATFRSVYKLSHRSTFMRTLQNRRQRGPSMQRKTLTEQQLRGDLEAHIQSETSTSASISDTKDDARQEGPNNEEDASAQQVVRVRKVLAPKSSHGEKAIAVARARHLGLPYATLLRGGWHRHFQGSD